MADWDEDSPTLQANLVGVLREIRDRVGRRTALSVEDARGWHSAIMQGLKVPNPAHVAHFRGEPGLKSLGVRVGRRRGTPPERVATDLQSFEVTLQAAVSELDRRIPHGVLPNDDGIAAVIDLAAWAHAKWVRIHPFANGNGRTARLWANALLMRYGLPPFVRLRPRPDHGYGNAGAAAMQGKWEPTAAAFHAMLGEFLESGA
ncbi:MAG TPA: Fic family protein [Candidatus Eisenbacteria bacterium]